MDLPVGTARLRAAPARPDRLTLWTKPTTLAITRPTTCVRHKGLLAQATKLGLCVTPQQQMEQDFFLSISKRMVPRMGSNVYQMVSYTLEGFPAEAVRALIPNEFQAAHSTSTHVEWSLDFQAMRRVLGDQMAALRKNLSAGISRGQMAPSESYIRVVATMLPPLEVSWWQPPLGRGRRASFGELPVCAGD